MSSSGGCMPAWRLISWDTEEIAASRISWESACTRWLAAARSYFPIRYNARACVRKAAAAKPWKKNAPSNHPDRRIAQARDCWRSDVGAEMDAQIDDQDRPATPTARYPGPPQHRESIALRYGLFLAREPQDTGIG